MVLKKIFDILISGIIILLVWPFVIFGLLISYFELQEFPIFKHERIGQYGKVIYIYKIRTLSSKQVFSQGKKINGSKYCAILRKYSFDELLQLINVLKGEMALIGPRPVTKYEWDNYIPATDAERQLILSFKPGLTGLWQVNGRNELNYQQRLEMDIKYCQTYSISNDWIIALKTISTIINGTG
ncbi:MAG: sugar transferase [Candidatus Brocadiae bacterium]|nr:sugar transferase [Candidatus Brocadiia bacterium]